MKTNRKFLVALGLASVLALSGCWNDDDGDAPVAETPPNPSVPDSAGASVASFVTYILGLSASDESSEPLTLKDTLAVPPDEAAEPTPL